jgi:hypothetical protein
MPFLSFRPQSFPLAAALLGTALALSGCSTPQERAAQKQAEVANMMALYGPACTRLGFAVDTDPWRNCIVNFSTKDDLARYGSYPGWGPYPYGYGGGWGRRW